MSARQSPERERRGTRRVTLVTGTGTGVGKTVLTALLARRLAERGRRVAALKPLASGGRADAVDLRAASRSGMALDLINPWHYRAALSPAIAAEQEHRGAPALAEVIRHIRGMAREHEEVLVEGAGGLLSPLGPDFNARDLARALEARVIIAAPNRLGVLNEVLLTLEALDAVPTEAAVVLMSMGRRTLVSRTNIAFLAGRLGPERVTDFPRVNRVTDLIRWRRPITARLAAALDHLMN